MCPAPVWLPGLVHISEYGNRWDIYIEALYRFFRKDFIETPLHFKGRPLYLKKHPLEYDKEATFWHFIEGSSSPNIRRCERIRWPRAIIDNIDDPLLKVWENERKGDKRILIYLDTEDYLVVLADREDFLLPWTAYTILHSHRSKKLLKEYNSFRKANAALYKDGIFTPSTHGR